MLNCSVAFLHTDNASFFFSAWRRTLTCIPHKKRSQNHLLMYIQYKYTVRWQATAIESQFHEKIMYCRVEACVFLPYMYNKFENVVSL